MTRWVYALTLCSLSLVQAAPVDDLRIAQLEQELRELQRQVQQQARRIETLEADALKPLPERIVRAERTPPRASIAWLRADNWNKLRIGMSQTEATDILGPPTSTRAAGDATQVLFYSLELDGGGFLSGQLSVQNDRVVAVLKPALR